MDVAMFQTPFQRPERSPREVFDWARSQAVVADKAGYTEYWIGEHATLNWESIPSPELVISACAAETEQISFGPGAHLLPYYHPSTLAIQVAWLSRVLEGRYMLGVGAGAYPSDASLRGITDLSVNHPMMEEALEIMNKIWKCEPFEFKGKFWNAGYPEKETGSNHGEWRDLSPWGGSVRIGMTALSEKSPSVAYAGTHGYMPLSVYAGDAFLNKHWEDYEAAAKAAGHDVDRSVHHVVRDVLVAETDAEAKKYAIEGAMGHAWSEYLLPTYKRFGILKGLLHDPDMDVEQVDLEYLAEHVWIVGSVDTVVEKFQSWFEHLGGFGTIIQYSHDYTDDPDLWVQSMDLLAKEVAPKIKMPATAGSH
jgi:alkanesulfonate monooxygenase SsuD/methylene tetrahydromethanopterin reductase-like flavin-dependent oxidoreductase (luciferase family)